MPCKANRASVDLNKMGCDRLALAKLLISDSTTTPWKRYISQGRIRLLTTVHYLLIDDSDIQSPRQVAVTKKGVCSVVDHVLRTSYRPHP